MGLKRWCIGLLFVIGLIVPVQAAVAQETDPAAETTEVGAVVFFCHSVDCADEPDEGMGYMEGAIVTSLAADGTELDSCTTGPNGCTDTLTIPADESGTFSIVAAPGYENYYLKSGTPEIVNQGGDVLGWTFLPSAEVEPEPNTAIMTVNACLNADCSSAELMDGTVITSYAADGTEVDTCEITVTPDQADYLGCGLTLPGEGGTFDIILGYENYALNSPDPEVRDAGEWGTLYIWTASQVSIPDQDGYAANVVYCDSLDDCAEPVTMDGAVVESYVADDLLDSCVVSSAPDDFDGCWIGIGANEISFDVIAPEGFEEYELVSAEPEIFDIEREGSAYRLFLFTFVLADDTTEPTATAEATATATATESGSVTRLPETGSGEATNQPGGNGYAALVVTLAGIGLIAVAGAMQKRRA